MAIIITDDDVRQYLTMPECIEAMRIAFRDYAGGKAKTLPRVRYKATETGELQYWWAQKWAFKDAAAQS